MEQPVPGTADATAAGPLTTEALAARHPLEPLDMDETEAARQVLESSGELGPDTVVCTLSLAEPPKSAVLAFPQAPVARCAEAVLLNHATGRVRIVRVDIHEHRVADAVEILGQQPSLTLDEMTTAMDLTRSDPAWQAAIAARGITDLGAVQIDPWPTGSFAPVGAETRRLVRCVAFVKPSPDDNAYARPVQGLMAVVDVARREVVAVEDHGVVALAAADGNYHRPCSGDWRTGLKPISITQPEGPSFEVEGHHVRWQGWDFRISLHPLEGLTLHQVGFGKPGSPRSVLYRASMGEMVVPYADPDPWFFWRSAFDAGEYGLGNFVNSLELGCDCVGEIRYFDAVTVDHTGAPVRRQNAICMHEEDWGILWKHTEPSSSVAHVRRARRLVVSSFATVGNYDYGVFWYFYLDGSIELEMKLTGILATKGSSAAQEERFATRIAPELSAPHHQHLFCFRLDFDLDGLNNTVYEVDVVPTPAEGGANPRGNAFEVVHTALIRESEGARRADASRARTWQVLNENHFNSLGQPTGYRLEPHASATLLAQPGSAIAARAAFATNHLWVTPFEDSETRPAGRFPNQSQGDDGLGRWTLADRDLRDTDVVVWHTFGPTHVARPEDWPVMPVERCGFALRPVGFFDRNPTLDVPPSSAGHCGP